MNTLVFEHAHTNGQAGTQTPSASFPQSKNGVLEHTHAPRTTKLYDRWQDEISLDGVEWIAI